MRAYGCSASAVDLQVLICTLPSYPQANHSKYKTECMHVLHFVICGPPGTLPQLGICMCLFFVLLSFQKQITSNTKRSARIFFIWSCAGLCYSASVVYLHLLITVLCVGFYKQIILNTGRSARIFVILYHAGLRILCLRCVSACAHVCTPW